MIYLIGTPIGNLKDISIRAIETLFSVDVLLCEDTRRTGLLLSELKKRYPELIPKEPKQQHLSSFYEYNEWKNLPSVISLAQSGKKIGVVSDGGMPVISDPGFLLVKEARKRNIPITSIPGPTAAYTALALSGFPTTPSTFYGFLPERPISRKKLLQSVFVAANLQPQVSIFYCAPHKLKKTLSDFLETFGDAQIVIARELTKIYEEVWMGSISEAIAYFESPKGEFVLLLMT